MESSDDDPASGRRKEDQAGQASARRIRVLAVDDDPSYLSYLRLVLTRAGFEVSLAPNGPAAIEHVRNTDGVDLLIVDLSMPQMDGIETVRRIHDEEGLPRIYSILLTAHGETETKIKALDGGLDDFLTKAMPESEIVAKIRSAARRLERERSIQDELNELETLALTDGLTGIANRRALFREAVLVAERKRPLTAAIIDLDRFKQINDIYGHLAGDRVLIDVAITLQNFTRTGDLVARYGGDEFVLLLPDTDQAEARKIAARLAERIGQLQWTAGEARFSVTATAGIASRSDASLEDLLRSCDEELYRLKRRDA